MFITAGPLKISVVICLQMCENKKICCDCRRINHAAGGFLQGASDWWNGIISTAPFSLTGNRGE